MVGGGARPSPSKLDIFQQNSTETTSNTSARRRNWLQFSLKSLPDFLHVLDSQAKVIYASPSCKTTTGHEPAGILTCSIINFIHPDDVDIFIKELDDSRAHASSTRLFYRFIKADQTWVILESRIQWFSGDQSHGALLPCRNVGDPGFIIMARPYQNKNTILLDSFLELKTEHERLSKRVAKLKREEQEEEAVEHGLQEEVEAPANGEGFLKLGFQKAGSSYKGDAGILIPVTKLGNDDVPGKRPKKSKVQRMMHLQVCMICGVAEAPEWRKGPKGPKTLCNACGLRWAKSNRPATKHRGKKGYNSGTDGS